MAWSDDSRMEIRDWHVCSHEYYSDALERKIHGLYISRTTQHDANAYDAHAWEKTKDKVIPNICLEDYQAGGAIYGLISFNKQFFRESIKNNRVMNSSIARMESSIEQVECVKELADISENLRLLDHVPVERLRILFDEWKNNKCGLTSRRFCAIMDEVIESAGFEPLTKVAPEVTNSPIGSMRS
jgi:hypothetical protein